MAARSRAALQAIALDALERLPSGASGQASLRCLNGGYLDLHNFRNRNWRPGQDAAGPDAPSAEQERREVELHLKVWRVMHPGTRVELADP